MNSDISQTQPPQFTVSEFSSLFKKMVETSFQKIRIKGEISGLKHHSSGHMYFAIKDENAVIDGVCWRGSASKLGFKPEEGMELICTGRITTYPGRSKYQMVVEAMEVSGVGTLLKLLEERKKKLAAEGLFDPSHKKELPFLPKVIGVITSPTGAVIRDIMHRLDDRYPTHVLLWPVLVQGDGAADQIAAAIEGFNTQFIGTSTAPRPDLIIVARGGGSVEDLWCFNEENVARAVFASDIPIISAVGHETDTTLVDYVSDKRAPTPTAAAEMAVPVRLDLISYAQDLGNRTTQQITKNLENFAHKLELFAGTLKSPKQQIEDKWLRLDDWSERLKNAELNHFDRRKQLLSRLTDLLKSYSHQQTLERGFTITMDAEGRTINSSKSIKKDQQLTLHWHDGDKQVLAK